MMFCVSTQQTMIKDCAAATFKSQHRLSIRWNWKTKGGGKYKEINSRARARAFQNELPPSLVFYRKTLAIVVEGREGFSGFSLDSNENTHNRNATKKPASKKKRGS